MVSCEVSGDFHCEKSGMLMTSGLEKPAGVACGLQIPWCMKTHIKSLGKAVGFVLAGALVAPLVGQAAALETATVAVDGVGSESSVVSGRVSAKGGK